MERRAPFRKQESAFAQIAKQCGQRFYCRGLKLAIFCVLQGRSCGSSNHCESLSRTRDYWCIDWPLSSETLECSLQTQGHALSQCDNQQTIREFPTGNRDQRPGLSQVESRLKVLTWLGSRAQTYRRGSEHGERLQSHMWSEGRMLPSRSASHPCRSDQDAAHRRFKPPYQCACLDKEEPGCRLSYHDAHRSTKRGLRTWGDRSKNALVGIAGECACLRLPDLLLRSLQCS